MWWFLACFLLVAHGMGLIVFSDARSPYAPVLIVVDGFTGHLGEYCKNYCDKSGIYLKDIVSPYVCEIFKSQGRSVPPYLRAPDAGTEVEWANTLGIVDNINTFCISESESGITTAERIKLALKLNGNNNMPQLRDKHLANLRASMAGLNTVKQTLAKSWPEAKAFISALWARNPRQQKCIVKPRRGVASEGVFLCENLDQAEAAFKRLFGKAQYGGGTNKAVLIQEYAEGPEYAVDAVVRL